MKTIVRLILATSILMLATSTVSLADGGSPIPPRTTQCSLCTLHP